MNKARLYNINPDCAYDGQQRSLVDFQFDLENVLTMSQLVGKSAEEGNAASVMLDIHAGTTNMDFFQETEKELQDQGTQLVVQQGTAEP